MAALLSCDVSNTDKVVLYINECKEHEIAVLPPDINESDHDFTVINDCIRFGLAAVKNVGGAALDSFMEEGGKDGPFMSLGDFCARVDSRKVNKRVIESLVKSGAFDSTGARRSQLFAILDQAMDHAQAAQRDKESGQLSLFSLMPTEVKEQSTVIPLPDIPEWPDQEKLAAEKETVGFYITGHPLDDFRRELSDICSTKISDLAELSDNIAVRVGGLFSSYKEHKSKKGDRMAFAVLEDTVGRVEVLVFPTAFAKSSHLLDAGQPVVVQGKLQKEEDQGAKIIADDILTLEEARLQYTSETKIMLKADLVNTGRLTELKKALQQNHGPCPVMLTLHFAGRGEADIESTELTVTPSLNFSEMVTKILGYQAASFKMSRPELKNRKKKNSKWRGRDKDNK
jgi:DNA polymerase-3 subunit alpha